jgi:hypothetical protein
MDSIAEALRRGGRATGLWLLGLEGKLKDLESALVLEKKESKRLHPPVARVRVA